jgi:hypothetical protein
MGKTVQTAGTTRLLGFSSVHWQSAVSRELHFGQTVYFIFGQMLGLRLERSRNKKREDFPLIFLKCGHASPNLNIQIK